MKTADVIANLKRWTEAAAQTCRPVLNWFPLTGPGLLVGLGCSVALFHYGLGRRDLLLLVVGAVGLGIASVSVLATLVTALVLRQKLKQLEPTTELLELECGFVARTGFTLPNLWYIPFIDLSWGWTNPTGAVTTSRRDTRVVESVRPRRRGEASAIQRRFTVRDIFGLARVSFDSIESRPVRFVPTMGALRHVHVVRAMSGGSDFAHPDGPPQGDRVDMRHYNPGDPIRFVLWKVFAKSRELLIRTPERAISPVRKTVAYLVASEGDEPAAGAARVAVDQGALGIDWVLGADGTTLSATTTAQALDVLTKSAATDPGQGGSGLKKFLSTATPGSIGRAVVFVPAIPGPWMNRVLAAAHPDAGQRSRLEFVVCTDGIRRTVARPGWHKVAFRETFSDDPNGDGSETPKQSRVEDVATVVKSLQSARANVLVVDRSSGKVFKEGHMRNMLEMAR